MSHVCRVCPIQADKVNEGLHAISIMAERKDSVQGQLHTK